MRRYYVSPLFLYRLFTLRKNARIPYSRLVALQEKRLRAIIGYAYSTVPFYHKLFDDNEIKPSDIKTVADLKRIPITTKKDVQQSLNRMISERVNVARCIRYRTSGSTGRPLTVFVDKDSKNLKSAVSLRQYLECGGRWRDKQVQLRGIGASSLQGRGKGKPFYEHLGLFRTEWVAIGPHMPDSLVPFLEDYAPDVLIGYPSFFQLLAEKAPIGEIRPRIVFCTAEILSSDCRSLINSAFGAKIIDCYGCTEAGDIAWECPDDGAGYHINCDSVVVEFVKDGEGVSSGEEGEVIITTLFNHAMPFVRYQINDVGVPSDERCSCGRTLPLMRLVMGRLDDFIVLPDGEKLSPQSIVSDRMKNVTDVCEYRIVQEKRDLIEVWLKMYNGYRQASVTRFVEALRETIGDDVEFRAHVVDEIPRDDSAKTRRIISKVHS